MYPMIHAVPPSLVAEAPAGESWSIVLGDAEGASLFGWLTAAGVTFAAGRSGSGWRFVGLGPPPRAGAAKVPADRVAALRAEIIRLPHAVCRGVWAAAVPPMIYT